MSKALEGIREEAGDTEDSALKSPHLTTAPDSAESKTLREKVQLLELEKAQLEEQMHSVEKESAEDSRSAKTKIAQLERENERLKEEVVKFGKVIAQSDGGDMKEEIEKLMNAVNEQLKQKTEEVRSFFV